MSKYFQASEMACHCCGRLPEEGIDPKLYTLLDDMRETVGEPLTINCSYRCYEHNLIVGGVENSQHTQSPCTAADVDASGIGVDRLAEVAESLGADGVGRYYDSEFVHVDVRSGRIGDNYRWVG